MDTSFDSDTYSIVQELHQDISLTDTGQASTEEQTYRKTMRGVRSYMGWTHIPDIDTHTSSAEDNPLLHPINSQWVK